MSYILSSEDLDVFEEEGFLILKEVFTENEIAAWERSLVMFHAFQALKIKELKARLNKGEDPHKYNSVEDLDKIIDIFEELDTKAPTPGSINFS